MKFQVVTSNTILDILRTKNMKITNENNSKIIKDRVIILSHNIHPQKDLSTYEDYIDISNFFVFLINLCSLKVKN
jgi:hypothetical protein